MLILFKLCIIKYIMTDKTPPLVTYLILDIYNNIFNFLEFTDIAPLIFTNKFFNQICISSEMWNDLMQLIKFIITIKGPQNFTLKQLCETKILKLDNGYGNAIPPEGNFVVSLLNNPTGIFDIPKGLGRLHNLEKLYLGGHGFTFIPLEIYNLTNLYFLSLRHNNLSTIPHELYKLHNLRTFTIGYNKLSTLPLELLNMPNLKHIYAPGNCIKTLPMEFCNSKISVTI